SRAGAARAGAAGRRTRGGSAGDGGARGRRGRGGAVHRRGGHGHVAAGRARGGVAALPRVLLHGVVDQVVDGALELPGHVLESLPQRLPTLETPLGLLVRVVHCLPPAPPPFVARVGLMQYSTKSPTVATFLSSRASPTDTAHSQSQSFASG